MDDCLVSLPSVDEAITIQKNLCDLLAKRGFRLRKWISNNDDVLNSIPDSEKSTSTLGHALEDSKKERLLGVLWKLKEDNFTFEVDLPQRPLTRRGILSALSSLHDPLGFVAPVVLEGRLILQSLCKRKAEWDEEITSHEAEKWLEWTSCLPAISSLNIPRCLYSSGLSQAKSLEIHNFCDASSFAYGACSYLKIVDKNDFSLYSFLMGKARLAPIKTVSIPRLELTAAVLSVRLNAAMKRALNIEYCVSKFWTDSMAVLHCIQNKSKRFPTFVANRLTIIEQNSNTADWHHIPTEMNPADIASRGASANSTKGLQAWLDGPEFLKDSSCLQVKNDLFDYEPPSDFQPLRKQEVYSCVKLETIDVIDKLIARRGKPHEMFTDNGSNFVGAEKVLRTALQTFNVDKIHCHCSQEGIVWSFNPPLASHMGGAWERMIRTIRKVLQSLLGRQTLNDESLLTLMAEVESIINSRPLVPICFSDSNQEPLTPNHLLLLRNSPNLPPGLFSKDDCYSKRRWAQVQYLANQFWRQWLKQFLPNLLNRQKWFQIKKNLQINDIVLLVEDTQQRSKWVLGRVIETYPDKNGLVRAVLVKTQSNVFKRSISKLCPVITDQAS